MPTFHVDVTIPPETRHLYIELAIAGGIHLGHGVMDPGIMKVEENGQFATVTGTVNAKKCKCLH